MAGGLCNRCLSGQGYRSGETIRAVGGIVAAGLRQASALIIARDNAQQLAANYRRQRDIARRSVTIAERQQAHLQDNFWPREIQFLEEFSEPEAIEAIEVMGRRYSGRLIASMAPVFAKEIRQAKANQSRYCTSKRGKDLQDLYLARATAFSSARVLGRNIAFAEAMARRERNFNRRVQAVAWGRGLLEQALNLYAGAAQNLASAGRIIAGRLEAALGAFGRATEQQFQALGRLSGARSGPSAASAQLGGARIAPDPTGSAVASPQIGNSINPGPMTAQNLPSRYVQNSFGQEMAMGSMMDLSAGQNAVTNWGADMGAFGPSMNLDPNSGWDHTEVRNYGQPNTEAVAHCGMIEIVDTNGDTAFVDMGMFNLCQSHHLDAQQRSAIGYNM